MNIHFQQAEKKSQVLFYILVGVAALTVLMLIWNAGRTIELQVSIPSLSGQVVYIENNSMPVAVPAPLPPAEQAQMTTMPAPSSTPSPLPRAVPVPVPDLP